MGFSWSQYDLVLLCTRHTSWCAASQGLAGVGPFRIQETVEEKVAHWAPMALVAFW